MEEGSQKKDLTGSSRLSREEFSERIRCIPRIMSAINARFGGRLNEHDLADLVQDTTIVVLRKIDRFQPGTSFESWVFRIGFLEYQNALRRKSKAAQALPEGGDEIPAEDSRTFEELYSGLERLEVDEAQVVGLKYFEGLTFEEIAMRLGIPVGTSKTRHYRGISKLQEYLKGRTAEVRHDGKNA